MISVIIATNESERTLVPTLAALVPGAVAGIVREVIVADAGSRDETEKVAEIAGCRFMPAPGPLGSRLRAAAHAARGRWLLFLQPGTVPDSTWIEDASRFIADGETSGRTDGLAAAFQAAGSRRSRPSVRDVLAMLARALGAPPKPQQGLLISKAAYLRMGGHDSSRADAEAALLRSLGRRRLVLLGCKISQSR